MCSLGIKGLGLDAVACQYRVQTKPQDLYLSWKTHFSWPSPAAGQSKRWLRISGRTRRQSPPGSTARTTAWTEAGNLNGAETPTIKKKKNACDPLVSQVTLLMLILSLISDPNTCYPQLGEQVKYIKYNT